MRHARENFEKVIDLQCKKKYWRHDDSVKHFNLNYECSHDPKGQFFFRVIMMEVEKVNMITLVGSKFKQSEVTTLLLTRNAQLCFLNNGWRNSKIPT
jgi:hypothetical protein